MTQADLLICGAVYERASRPVVHAPEQESIFGAVVDTRRRIVRGGRPLLPVSTRTSFAGVVTVERGLRY